MPQAPGSQNSGTRSRQAGQLARLVHRRWSLHVLAETRASGGAKLITLSNRTGATPAAAKASAEHLVSLGLLERPSGPGHPLRPEYVVAPGAEPVAAAAAGLVAWIRKRDEAESLLRKWSLPTIWAIESGARRFGEIRAGLPAITDRALALSLDQLNAARFVERLVLDARPPASAYVLTRRARSIGSPLGELAAQLMAAG